MGLEVAETPRRRLSWRMPASRSSPTTHNNGQRDRRLETNKDATGLLGTWGVGGDLKCDYDLRTLFVDCLWSCSNGGLGGAIQNADGAGKLAKMIKPILPCFISCLWRPHWIPHCISNC